MPAQAKPDEGGQGCIGFDEILKSVEGRHRLEFPPRWYGKRRDGGTRRGRPESARRDRRSGTSPRWPGSCAPIHQRCRDLDTLVAADLTRVTGLPPDGTASSDHHRQLRCGPTEESEKERCAFSVMDRCQTTGPS